MFRKTLGVLREEYLKYTLKDKLFILFSTLCVFFISVEYSITRPASNSILIAHYSAKIFPYAWLATVPINFLVIYYYNKFLPKLGCLKMWYFVSIISIAINCLSSFFVEDISELSFLQFVWKEIYILLMYKQVWSLIHTSISRERAKYIYGIIFTIGGVGGILGGAVPGFLATYMGSKQLFLFTAPIYLMLILLYKGAFNNGRFSGTFDEEKKGSSFKSIKSRYFICILLLVTLMQITVGITNYQFHIFLEHNIPDMDLRTEYIGRIVSIIHILTTSMQFISGILIIKMLGLKKIHLMIPLSFILNGLIFLIRPTFFMISYLFVYIKSVDFSVFSIAKEMLYIPMKNEERFKSKAVIDVFMLRSAKAFAAILALVLQLYNMTFVLSYITLIIFISWLFLLRVLFFHHELRTAEIT